MAGAHNPQGTSRLNLADTLRMGRESTHTFLPAALAAAVDSTRNQLRITPNPLLSTHAVRSVDVAEIAAPTVYRHPLRAAMRDLRDLRRKQTAAQAIAGLDHTHELYGFTKGQFGLLQLLEAIIDRTGPARVSLSTWTAARHEIQTLDRHVREGRLLSMRWLIDFSFARRDPEAAHQIRQTFGLDAIRVAQNHSKFALIEAPGWELVLRTSMNLNMNPRLEDFTLAHDPTLASFLRDVLGDIWTRQKRSLADASGREQRQFFAHEL